MSANALKGTVERYISPPREEGFAILSIKLPDGARAKICGKGLAGLASGQTIEVTGSWNNHHRWGKEFRARDVKIVIPEEGVGLQRWIVQTGIPGVGEATARKLVQEFGKDTVTRIADGDERSRRLLGKHFDEAQRLMIVHKAEAAFGPLLAEHEIGPSLREKIFKTYGLQTARKIEKDPYRLIGDIDGIAFATADRIASAIGIQVHSRSRLVAAAIDALRSAANEGHTAVPNPMLARMITARTSIKGPEVEKILADIGHPQVIATTITDKSGNILDGWALRALHRAEETIAQNVLAKLEQPSLITARNARHYVTLAEMALRVSLNTEQRAGAVMALSHSLSILTGGPGTGKTTTLNVITTAWRLAAADGWVKGDIKLGAPTGKASMRMKEATNIDATTIHRLLETNRDGSFARDEDRPLEAGLIAIDESSMKDALLAADLTRAWGDANVLLIGDADQLTSVGAGRVLGDLIASGIVPVTKLEEIRRQAKGSAIAEGAKAIREGLLPVMEPGSDLMFIECDDNDKVAEITANLYAAFEADGMGVQVLTPGCQAETGTIALNSRLQAKAALQGEDAPISGGATVRAGDKVIQIVNDHDAEVFNGDVGQVLSVKDGEIVVQLGGREISASGDALRHIALAYALTVHKSQGSEFDVVILPVTVSHWMLLRRTLIYTALTRAKHVCVIVGSLRAFKRAIANDDGNARITTLAQKLRSTR